MRSEENLKKRLEKRPRELLLIANDSGLQLARATTTGAGDIAGAKPHEIRDGVVLLELLQGLIVIWFDGFPEKRLERRTKS